MTGVQASHLPSKMKAGLPITLPRVPNGAAIQRAASAYRNCIKKSRISRAKRSAAMACWAADMERVLHYMALPS